MIVREASSDDAPAIARVHLYTWRTTYRGIVPKSVLTNLSYDSRKNSWVQILSNATKKNHFVYVAEDEAGQIVAFADGGPERTGDPIYKGELYAIYILTDYQLKGIGRRLTLAVAENLAVIGIHSMLVWVLEDNPSFRFYEALGGQKVYEKRIQIGRVMLNEVAYGWLNTRVLWQTH